MNAQLISNDEWTSRKDNRGRATAAGVMMYVSAQKQRRRVVLNYQ